MALMNYSTLYNDVNDDMTDPHALWKRVARASLGDTSIPGGEAPEMRPHSNLPIGDFPEASGDFSSSPASVKPSGPPPIPDESTELQPRSNPNPTATGGKAEGPSAIPAATAPQPKTLDDYLTAGPELKPAKRLVPQEDLPDITTMPGYDRMTDLQDRLDKAQQKPTLKQRLLRLAVTAAPVAIGGIFGGLEGAGGAASGAVDEVNTQDQAHRHNIDDLIRQVDQSQRGVDQQYGHILHSRDVAANRESTAAYRQANIDAQNNRAADAESGRNNRSDTRAATALRLHGLDENGDPIPEDQLSAVDKMKLQHQKNQDELLDATVAYRKAQTDAIPEQLKIARDRLSLARQHLSDSAARLALAQRGMDLREESLDYRENGPTAATKTKKEQADAVQAVGGELIKTIRANKDLLGPVSGRVNNLEELWGNLSPEAARISGLQGSFAALQPALHGMRSQKAMQEFERRLQAGSFKTNADAMEAGVQAAMDSAALMRKAYDKPLNSAAQDRRKARNNAQTPGGGEDVVEFEMDPITHKPVKKVVPAGGR